MIREKLIQNFEEFIYLYFSFLESVYEKFHPNRSLLSWWRDCYSIYHKWTWPEYALYHGSFYIL